METRHINHKSDFVLRERFRDGNGNVVSLPDMDFTLRYWVRTGNVFEAGRKDGAYYNCVADGDAMLVLLKDHRLGEGVLKHELQLQLDNALFADGVQTVYYPDRLNIELWQWRGDTEGVVESDTVAAYTRGAAFTYEDFTPEQIAALKGERGEPFRWEDFTAAQIVELKRPATEAAERADQAAQAAKEAAEAVRKEADTLRTTSAEAVRNCDTAHTGAEKATEEVRKAGQTAVADCNRAGEKAGQGAVNAETSAQAAEQTRRKLEAMAELVEQAARMVPTGLRVNSPTRITLGNGTAQYIRARVKPDYALQNVIYLTDGTAVKVMPDGRVEAQEAGTATVHVIPTAGVEYYKTVRIEVNAPHIRMAGGTFRMDGKGNIRLT